MFDSPLFGAMKTRAAWTSERQEILSHNIANANTPKYRPRDLRAFSFPDILKRKQTQLNMVTTDEAHNGGKRKRIRDFDEVVERVPFETAPDGNSIIMEEQLTKMNETSISHRLTNSLYKKHLSLLKTAIGRR
ncbi:MAG: flagellar basal body rod protein FlgB [Rhodospirillales bacterium]